ncbi:hypothetical protein DQ04_03041080 [Trypanosoma grayi]|uniref:hypothetical protein n=1 Tax=Trypanosoma grayi TaxID=71804 RepID=UPI0004F3FC55|nr:hypothetical protein DQ04_03041080 [Trypanosoma grayi]KEG11037.1 hypothetical protein DQ04_03041080 [Trypanosoma grayi]
MSQRIGSQSPQDHKGSFSSDSTGLDATSFSFATGTHEEAMEQLRQAHTALEKYIKVEMETSTEELQLLGRCNDVLRKRCEMVQTSARGAVQELEATAEVMKHLRLQFARVDAVETQLASLTTTVNKIDEYSKALADRFDCA